MKYVSDKPIDFTNQDWKQHTPRERARLEARREEEEKRKRALARKKSGPRILLEWALQIGIVILFAYVAVYIRTDKNECGPVHGPDAFRRGYASD